VINVEFRLPVVRHARRDWNETLRALVVERRTERRGEAHGCKTSENKLEIKGCFERKTGLKSLHLLSNSCNTRK
jgi:Tat protein secretion system quality control protein TatD with DNase activity